MHCVSPSRRVTGAIIISFTDLPTEPPSFAWRLWHLSGSGRNGRAHPAGGRALAGSLRAIGNALWRGRGCGMALRISCRSGCRGRRIRCRRSDLHSPCTRLRFSSRENVLGLALYMFSCSLIAGFGEALRRERRRAQTTSGQLRIVTEGIAAGAAQCSRDMRYLWVNQPYSDWIQIPADELIGKSIADVVGPEAFAQLLPYVKRVLDGQTVHYEKEVAFKGKTPCWVSTNYTPTRDENGVVDGWVAVVLDISAHKHAEEELVRSRQQISADFDALTRLQSVANRCGAADNQFDECLHVILDAAIAFTHCDRGHLQLLDADNTVLRLVSHRGFE